MAAQQAGRVSKRGWQWCVGRRKEEGKGGERGSLYNLAWEASLTPSGLAGIDNAIMALR